MTGETLHSGAELYITKQTLHDAEFPLHGGGDIHGPFLYMAKKTIHGHVYDIYIDYT